MDALRVGIEEGAIVFMDEAGAVVWEDHDEHRLIQRLFEFSVARDAINLVTDLADWAERHEGTQPQFAKRDAALIASARLVVAKSLPSHREVEQLIRRSTQLGLWGRRAA
jgi:hypothetical protein